jgi:hypothetical protein
MRIRTALAVAAWLAVALTLSGCGGGAPRDKSIQPSDVGGCLISAYVRDDLSAKQLGELSRLLQADEDVGAFEFLSKQRQLRETYPPLRKKLEPLRAYFKIVPARADSLGPLRATLRREPAIVEMRQKSCPLLAHESGTATYGREDVVTAFAAQGFRLTPFKPPAGSPQPSPLTGGSLLLPPPRTPFFVFVGNNPEQARRYYDEFTRQPAVGTIDLRQGNVLVSSEGGLNSGQLARIRAALKSLSS